MVDSPRSVCGDDNKGTVAFRNFHDPKATVLIGEGQEHRPVDEDPVLFRVIEEQVMIFIRNTPEHAVLPTHAPSAYRCGVSPGQASDDLPAAKQFDDGRGRLEPDNTGGLSVSHGDYGCDNRNDSSSLDVANQAIFFRGEVGYPLGAAQPFSDQKTVNKTDDMKNWLRAALKASGKSQAALSRHLTIAIGRAIDKTAVNKMLSGLRQIKADEILEISRFTGATLPGHLSKPDLTTRSAGKVVELSFLGSAETGAFRQTGAPDGDPLGASRTVAVPFDVRFPHARQFILQQLGEGMATAAPPIANGAYVRCVHAKDAGIDLKDGQVVVVERRHPAAMDLLERSLRRVRAVGGGLRFVAESQTAHDDLEPGPHVEVTAFVTAVINVLDVI